MKLLVMLLALVGGLQCHNCVFRVVIMLSAMPICLQSGRSPCFWPLTLLLDALCGVLVRAAACAERCWYAGRQRAERRCCRRRKRQDSACAPWAAIRSGCALHTTRSAPRLPRPWPCHAACGLLASKPSAACGASLRRRRRPARRQQPALRPLPLLTRPCQPGPC